MPRIDVPTRVALVMHHREVDKTTATGPLALASLVRSELHVHGLRDAPLDLNHLHGEGRRVLVLFPAEGAMPLDQALRDDDPRPCTLVVPDGNWRQARRIPRRIPGLQRAQCVTLPDGGPSRWGVRREPRPEGLATFEAIARALGILESPEVQAQLEAFFARVVETTLAARGPQQLATPGTAAPREPEAQIEAQGKTEVAGGRDRRALDPPPGELPIVYLDDYLVAVHKPSGVPSHRGWARDGVPALQRVRDQIGRHLYPVHRLDRATSGVLLFALSSEVARDMQSIFGRAEMLKRYLALCRGHDASLVRVDHPLARAGGQEKRPAVTDLRLLGAFERYGLYEALPRSGRTHQVRRHLKHASHPIIGDVRYGKGEHNRLFRERFGFHRLALHCHRMTFPHPRGGTSLTVEAPPGEDFSALLRALGLHPEKSSPVAS